MRSVAMFPLGAVLFPHMPITLRVFEERYLAMLGRMLEGESPEFGVVLIERGAEVGGGDQRFGIGTMARLVELGSGDGTIAIAARGGLRFEVLEWLQEDPYPMAVVRDLPELAWEAACAALRDEAERAVRGVLARAGEFVELPWSADIVLDEDPVAASWQLAGIAPVGALDQVRLLGATSVRDLLEGVIAAVREVEPTLTAPPPTGEADIELAELLGDADEDEDGAAGGA
ncbi:LON peptidase substrate-binding domain-containing protein [Agromyces sp. SYSU T00194]|uniref:LON peptidase substrate-binding domain-containing protein n=1 Tax=Agromyces chitinivorans TaxID=3158560 RepID=UPI0033912B6F